MKENDGGVERRGGEGFNYLCLGVFLNRRGKDLRGFKGLTYSSKSLISNSLKLESFGRERD